MRVLRHRCCPRLPYQNCSVYAYRCTEMKETFDLAMAGRHRRILKCLFFAACLSHCNRNSLQCRCLLNGVEMEVLVCESVAYSVKMCREIAVSATECLEPALSYQTLVRTRTVEAPVVFNTVALRLLACCLQSLL